MSAGGGREEGAAAAAMLQLLREQPEPQAEESGAQRFALCLPPGEEEVKEVEETIEEMLIRLDEFCGMTDVIRSDTSQILDETIPLIKAKVVEMNNIYAKVDKLEAFVKMVGRHVSFLEEQVLQAEGNHNTVSHAVRKLLQSAAIPSFKNKHTPSAQHTYDLPKLYRTEDYFPTNYKQEEHSDAHQAHSNKGSLVLQIPDQ
ncbi:breast carcinoma-amplified sequence 4 isoform X4 [Chelonia mydas]|uniref:breast carcinoma-amplified sequence 4 isoform X4 n=1 Tax=Chelonia mydas TaxID=8469 RepID=UPI001CA8A2EB|nr:breast carcinoma-amplified sequence 4 isoform X4 [Chelonia mydas]